MLTKERNLYYDFIRIIACFLVIVNHTIAPFDHFDSIGLSSWLITDVMFSLCKMAVSLFVMLSGALLLGKQESYKKVFVNRTLKIVSILLIWSSIYYMWNCWYDKKLISLEKLLTNIPNYIAKPISLHLWYLYMVIGLYIMLPFTRKMIKNFDKKDSIIFLGIWIAFSCFIPFVNSFYPIILSENFQLPIFYGFFGCFFAGYYLDKIQLNRKIIVVSVIIFITSLLTSTIHTLYFSSLFGFTSRKLDNPLIFPVMICSITFFLILKYILTNLNSKLYKLRVNKIIVDLSNATLGIYVIHMLIHNSLFQTSIIKNHFSNISYSVHQVIVYEIMLFIICYIIVTLFKRIPLLKYIV
ncbi:acyltransferase family protein [Clostridium sp. YIM B02505]|uniref:Acyltransferase family protein n=1 Tax=Clostridium yunnanense TaxID=2800325 RepID=A0ABS1EX63_9CLOT|nr:acyltransferase family protein [Clostridium yunnanense]MBK1813899.1 acyltransferase family protein [Clostridium yunnanense]